MCASTRHPTRNGPQHSEDTRSGGPARSALGTDQELGRQTTKHISGVVVGRDARFQRLGPNAGGGAERGMGGCWWGDVVVVCLVGGTALRVAGSWFGVCGGS
jgi:hypothetical protein